MAVYDVTSFGATGNGVSDDTAALNAAIAACGSGTSAGVVYLPAGTYRITSTLQASFKVGCTIRGDGRGASYIKNATGSSNAITFTSCQYCGVEELDIFNDTSIGLPTGGYAIEFNGNSYDNHVMKVNLSEIYSGIRVFSCSETIIHQVLVRGIYGQFGIHYSGTSGTPCYGMTVEDFITDVLDRPATGAIGIYMDSYAYSLTVRRAALLRGGYGFWMADTINNGSSQSLFAELDDLECDHNNFAGVILTGGQGVFMSNCWVGSCLQGNGIYIAGGFGGDMAVATTRIVGNAQHGVLIEAGPNGITFGASTIGANGQQTPGNFHGITLGTNHANTVISGCKIGSLANFGGAQGYGVFVASGCNGYVVTSNNLRGNLSGGLFNGGTTPNAVANNVV